MKQKINFQNKSQPLDGWIESNWFENLDSGISRSLFYSISIPFAPFNSGLDHIPQPESPLLLIEWLVLEIKKPLDLSMIQISSENYTRSESSLYLGSVHNWVNIISCRFAHLHKKRFMITIDAIIDFETEKIAKNERLQFSTPIDFR